MPAGAHKGFGLAVLVEALAGLLSGAAMTSDVVFSPEPGEASGTGHTVIAIDVASFADPAEFAARIAELRRRMHDAERVDPETSVMLPGELEHRHAQEVQRDGLAFDAASWGQLWSLAEELELTQVLAAATRR